MKRKITIIPPKEETEIGSSRHNRRRVAAYVRVSTENDSQGKSFESQVLYFTKYILSRKDWKYAGIYTDEGQTGTNTSHRDGFNRMIADALEGRFDMIITKSVSRFARNTLDSLSTIRLLKDHGVEVFFEKENIRTMDGKGEVLLTILSSLAQEEARSASENCKWGIRKRFADGKFAFPYSHLMGYDMGPDGNPVINESQAEIIRRIFNRFIGGTTLSEIAKELNDEKVPTPMGKTVWYITTIRKILKNEKYKGDVLLQKTIKPDFLTKKQIPNDGSVNQYYIEGNHEPIVSEEIFDTAQSILAYKASKKQFYNVKYTFSGLVFCSHCGRLFGPKERYSNNRYSRTVWQCNGRFRNEDCTSKAIRKEKLEAAFIYAAEYVFSNKDGIIREIRLKTGDDSRIRTADSDIRKLEHDITETINEINRFYNSGDHNAFQQMEQQYADQKAKLKNLKSNRDEMVAIRQRMKNYATYLEETDKPAKFRESDFRSMFLRIITDGENLTFTFMDEGTLPIKLSDLPD